MGERNGPGTDRTLSSAQKLSDVEGNPDEFLNCGGPWGSVNGATGGGVINEGYGPRERGVPHELGGGDGDAGEISVGHRKGKRRKAHSPVNAVENDLVGGADGGAVKQLIDGSQNSGEQELRFPRWNDFQVLEGQDRRRGGSSEWGIGEQAPQLTSLFPAPPDPHLRQGSDIMAVDSPSDNLISNGFVTDERPRQWLKTLLPEADSGWWDVYTKGKGFAIKFCWRDNGPKKLTFPRISLEEYRMFSLNGEDEVKDELRTKIVEHLRNILRDPAKSAKALAAAERLRIDLDVHDVNILPVKEL